MKKTKKRKISPSAKKKLSVAGVKIMNGAKKIYYAKGNKLKWQSCVKKAAKALKK